MAKEKIAIFDLDGTLFDTKNVNYEAYNRALKETGLTMKCDYNFYCDNCNGRDYKTFLPIICNGITDKQMEEVHRRKQEFYKEYLSKARMNDSLFALIEAIKSDYHIALGTTASKENTYEILKHFDVDWLFDLIVTKEDTIRYKPDPECFITIMNYFNVKKQDTIIFEDSDVGIKAAEKSGARYVRVYGYN